MAQSYVGKTFFFRPNLAALRALIRLLKRVDDKEFDMRDWKRCNTVGCAIGHAASDPWFNKRGRGFYLDRDNKPTYVQKLSTSPVLSTRVTKKSWDAVEAFFCLTEAEAHYLFTAHHYTPANPPRAVVIARLQSFIEERSGFA